MLTHIEQIREEGKARDQKLVDLFKITNATKDAIHRVELAFTNKLHTVDKDLSSHKSKVIGVGIAAGAIVSMVAWFIQAVIIPYFTK